MESTGPSAAPERRRGRWWIAAGVSCACPAISFLVIVHTDWPSLIRVVLAFPAMTGVALYLAAWIQRRPRESLTSVFASTLVTALIGALWLVNGPRSLADCGVAPYPMTVRHCLEHGQWRPALGTLLLALPVATVMFMLLVMWMPVRTRLMLAIAASALFLATDLVAAEFPFVWNLRGGDIPMMVFSLSATVLAWACIANPYSRDWAHQCRACRYDLRGIQAESCPECGAAIPNWMLKNLRGVIEPAGAPVESGPLPNPDPPSQQGQHPDAKP